MECSSSKRRFLIIIGALFLAIGLVGLIILCVLFALSINVGKMVSRIVWKQTTLFPLITPVFVVVTCRFFCECFSVINRKLCHFR
ncbi:uncharacterized protein DEA37_0000692 [Paragonimus westermani]|uniref:Uncharacterized protein n=1 Tax=Paragonimus westermani TaxID=34504 RepID=A0A5J4NCC1_9TREM|nr:uncharacterized protein DEA37_0000692 [Paragonimus westermani]